LKGKIQGEGRGKAFGEYRGNIRGENIGGKGGAPFPLFIQKGKRGEGERGGRNSSLKWGNSGEGESFPEFI